MASGHQLMMCSPHSYKETKKTLSKIKFTDNIENCTFSISTLPCQYSSSISATAGHLELADFLASVIGLQ